MFRNTETISLFGHDLIISERIAFDVLRFETERKKSGNDDAAKNLMFLAAVISDSLKVNWENANFLKKRKLKKITSCQYLMEHCTLKELVDLNKMISKLEGDEIDDEQDESKKKDSHLAEQA